MNKMTSSEKCARTMTGWGYIVGFVVPFGLIVVLNHLPELDTLSRLISVAAIRAFLMLVSCFSLARFVWCINRVLGRKGWPAFLLFIPLFNLVWQYVVVFPLGKRLAETLKQRNIQGVELGDTFSSGSCHLLVVAFLLLPAGSFFQSPAITIIASVVFLLWMLLVTLMFYNYSKVVNAIMAGSTPAQETK